MKKSLFVVFILLFVSACSVSESMTGHEVPANFNKVMVGADHDTVNSVFGHPTKVILSRKGERLHVYDVKAGRQASAPNFVANLTMGLATAALWEFMGDLESSKIRYNVIYDENDKVASIDSYRVVDRR